MNAHTRIASSALESRLARTLTQDFAWFRMHRRTCRIREATEPELERIDVAFGDNRMTRIIGPGQIMLAGVCSAGCGVVLRTFWIAKDTDAVCIDSDLGAIECIDNVGPCTPKMVAFETCSRGTGTVVILP